jgi:DNA gyrase/topoisomerase IV subunit B
MKKKDLLKECWIAAQKAISLSFVDNTKTFEQWYNENIPVKIKKEKVSTLSETTTKIHFRGKRVEFNEQQEFTFLQRYEDYHSICGYLYLKKEVKTYTTEATKVTCKRCLIVMKELSLR